MLPLDNPLRVALLAANLSRGGAEKQLVYMAKALREAGVDVRVYSLTRGQFHESALEAMGLAPIWVGARGSPLIRLAVLARHFRRFRPHVIQSTHSFANLYVGLLGRLLGCVSVGSLRSSLEHCRQANGAWTPWLIRTPSAVLVNAQSALDDLARRRLVSPDRLFWLPNVIDLAEFDRSEEANGSRRPGLTVALVGRLVEVKRIDRYLHALAAAAQRELMVRGMVIGDGPQRAALERLAVELGLGRTQVEFLGEREDVPRLLALADVLVQCSDDEGLPNAVLEAMAARRPAITTPAGDAHRLIRDGHNGYVVPFDDVSAMAERLVLLARLPQLRRQLGEAGRQHVERHYSLDGLADRLLSIYRTVAARQKSGAWTRAVVGPARRLASRPDSAPSPARDGRSNPHDTCSLEHR